jgi:pyruvate,water dikinase
MRTPVAVRSSSPSEDRADASFAGQYDTILGVRTPEALIEALERCWRSASSAAATAYRTAQGDEGGVEMAVLVQELVPATAAGVLFTIHPVTERTDQMVVNSNFGFGESVVSGRAEPDTFVIDKATGAAAETVLGAKRVTSELTEQGVVEVPAQDGRQATPSLSANQLRQLADAARRLEDWFDFPMDAEFAFEGDTLHMLQARPVTTGGGAYFTGLLDQWVRDRGLETDPEAIWARGSPLSGMPVTPLYYSEMAAFFSDMFPEVAGLHGATAGKRRSVRYYNGYSYSDVTFASRADPGGALKPIGFFSEAWRSNLAIAARYPSTLSFWANIDHYYQKWHDEWLPGLDLHRPDYAHAQPGQIRSFIEYVETQRRERSIVAALGVGYAGDYLGLLVHLVERWAPGADPDTVGVLTSGLSESLTHDENLDLWRLAKSAEARPAVRDVILRSEYSSIASVSGGPDFLSELGAFQAKRPHRGCSDRDLYQPRWGDDAALLLNQIGAILRLGELADPAVAHARTALRRRKRELEILEQVGRGRLGALRVAIFEGVLRAAQRYWMQRDNQRHTFDHYFWELRCAYRALGARLAQSGALEDAKDVFFAGKTELYAHLDGALSAARLRARAAWRRPWWEKVSQQEPPPFLKGNQPHDPGFAAEAGEGDLSGTGGAPGVVTGPVRHVRTLAELGSVGPGDILVTHAIDPAWTPVFGIIGGVISEEGGMLSHATVLGREYGLPVVIGARGATSLLTDGDLVRINGTTGVVMIVEGQSANNGNSAQSGGKP